MATLASFINEKCVGKSHAEVVAYTLAAVTALKIVHALTAEGRVHKRFLKAVFAAGRTLAAPLINREVNKAASTITFPQKDSEQVYERLPVSGLSEAEVTAMCEALHDTLDHGYGAGGLSGAVYHGGENFTSMINKVMEIFQWSNPLHVDVFGATRKMEAEIASMVVDMYNGLPRGACGAVTSGGTESIGMAIKTYREWGREKLGITKPNIVAPITAHPAFDKGCSYYGVELIKVPVGPSGRVDPSELEAYINANTVAIVGSSPTFPHGTIDPIPILSEIAHKRGIGMHVDACLGSFIVPFLNELGVNAPVVDFRNRGVTTISCDTHKYGFAPKGTSVIMYASKELRAFQFFTIAEWPGGIYCSPGASGSKPGNVIAGTWAALLFHGRGGYLETARKIVGARQIMSEGVRKIPGFRILGDPLGSVFGFTSDTVDIYVVNDRLKKKGWMLNPLQFPCGLQFSVTLLQTAEGIPDRFVADLNEINSALLAEYDAMRARGEKVKIGLAGATMYGSQQNIPDRSILDMIMKQYLDGYYGTRHAANLKIMS